MRLRAWIRTMRWGGLLLPYEHRSFTEGSESLTLFVAKGEKCWRDSYGKPQCGEQPCDCEPGYVPCPGEDFCCRKITTSIPNRSQSLNLFSFPARGQKCWRDSYNKTQCGEPPCDGRPGYEPCPGEDFCCRASTLFMLSCSESLNFLSATGQQCWRDSYNKTQCGNKPCDCDPGYEPCPGEDVCCRTIITFIMDWSGLLNLSYFPAQGQKCWRDSYNKTQCGEPPCDGIPGYEPCPGEDFCCRAFVLFKLNWFESLNLSSFPAAGQQCWRDSYNKTQCGNKPCDCEPGYEQCDGEDYCCRTTL